MVGGVADFGSGGVGRCVGVCDFGGIGWAVIVTGVAVIDGVDEYETVRVEKGHKRFDLASMSSGKGGIDFKMKLTRMRRM